VRADLVAGCRSRSGGHSVLPKLHVTYHVAALRKCIRHAAVQVLAPTEESQDEVASPNGLATEVPIGGPLPVRRSLQRE
jgi:hypothetical protein